MTYTDLAMRTASNMPTPALDFAHAALGLVDESYELLTATSEENALEELGDLCWFLALAGRSLEYDPFVTEAGSHEEFRSSGSLHCMIEWLGEHAALVAGVAKKWMVYGRLPDAAINHRLARMVALVRVIGEDHGWTLDYIQDANIRKLKKRFPDGFTDHDASHRDTDGEMQAMRGES